MPKFRFTGKAELRAKEFDVIIEAEDLDRANEQLDYEVEYQVGFSPDYEIEYYSNLETHTLDD